jgi:outer membrane protein assembly factor BamA
MKFSLVLSLVLLVQGIPNDAVADQQAFLPAAIQVDSGNTQPELIAAIEIQGYRRVPVETIRARISIKPGDVYDPNRIERDVKSLLKTGYFETVRSEREKSDRGWIVHFYLKEKPTTADTHGR